MRLKSNPLTPEREVIFWSCVDVEPGQCWLWTRPTKPDGYGQFRVTSGNARPAHKIAYEILVGPVPPGYHLHHHCQTKHCVNPDHVEPMTPLQHRQHSSVRVRQFCQKGHPVSPSTYDRSYHRCRICMADRTKRARREGRPYAVRNGHWYKKRREAA